MRLYTFLAMGYREFFAKRLKAARMERGYTQDRLAHISGVNLNSIAKYETCVIIPTVETLHKLAEALEVSGDYFLFEYAKMEGIPKVGDPELYERYFILEKLGEDDRNAALNLLDALVARHRFQELATTTKPAPPASHKTSQPTHPHKPAQKTAHA
jgi:transcriptional regulator with XRE-family HTH domain